MTLFDDDAAQAARAHQNALTKPPGSLGRLEVLAVQLAGYQRSVLPRARPAAALIFASDHPVTRHGVSVYPSSVTRAMVRNFLVGGAAASVLARSQGIALHVVDVGVDPGPYELPCARGADTYMRHSCTEMKAGDLRIEDAMSPALFGACREAGRVAVERLPEGTRVLLLGEMGIGNTTAAAAVCAALLGGDPRSFVGRGTGATYEVLERKRQVVADAIARIGTENDPMEVVRRVGGRDIAALVGAMEAAVEMRRVIVVDGFIVSAAALAFLRLRPEAYPGLVFAHRGNEQAHGRVLESLDARPLLDLDLRLGEASGALVAFSLIEHACALHGEMATFESASVPDRIA